MPSGVVKFFDVDRGYGFIVPDDGHEDIVVHGSAVEAAGLTAIGEGDLLEFDVENQNGRFTATELALVEKRSAVGPVGRRNSHQSGQAERQVSIRGVVKWYNPTKGFGFIAPASGGEDIFVHVSAVERAGLPPLTEGQVVLFRPERDRRTGKVSANALSAA